MKLAAFALLSACGQLAAGTAIGFESNENRMDRLMSLKIESTNKMKAEGAFDSGKYERPAKAGYTKCKDGKAGEYSCSGIDLADFLTHEQMGSTTREGNDVWGWTSADGREFGAVGETDGTAFVEVLKKGALKYLGRLPTQTVSSTWRDIKVIDGYAYIGAEAQGHGLQVFDMRKLLNVTTPKTYNVKTDLTAWYSGFGSSHNIVSNEDTKMIYAVGTQRSLSCKGGLWIVDVSNPAKPTSPGCASADGYVHDAQCVIYKGPDAAFRGNEICFAYNEDTLTIYDVTEKKSPKVLSTTPYIGSAYTHQGWLIDEEEQTFLLLDDELDEMDKTGEAANQRTTTYIFNVTSLEKPGYSGFYQSPAKAIDHNQYVINGLSYQSNYGSGLRVVDVSSYKTDPTGKSMKEAGFFDCHPEDDAEGGVAEFYGSWSVYPYFKSGYILLNSIERGVYSLKTTF